MYKETKETIFTILLTALIVGGGMYGYYNYGQEDIDENSTPQIENETNEEVVEETENTQDTITADTITYKTIDVGTLYQVEIPSTWIVENIPTEDGRKVSRIVDENNIKVGEIFCPLIDTYYPGWNVETMEKMLNLNQIVLWKATQKEGNTGDIKAMAILFLHSRNYQARCQIGVSMVDHNQEEMFDVYEHMYDSVKTKEKAEQIFEPETFHNNVMKYSMDRPKNWYWNHYGYQNETMRDIASFSTNPLSEYLGSYPGKITVQVLAREINTTINEHANDLENMTKELIQFNGIDATKVRGELPLDGMSVGNTRVVLSVFFQKDGLTYIINTMGPTPEEEEIFNQMVNSFKFGS